MKESYSLSQESNANKFSLVSESRFQSNSDASMSSWWLQFSLPKASRISRFEDGMDIYILPDMEGIHAGQAYFKQYLEGCR